MNMSTKSRIVLVAGSVGHGSSSHEHLGGCLLLNEMWTVLKAMVTQGWPAEQSI